MKAHHSCSTGSGPRSCEPPSPTTRCTAIADVLEREGFVYRRSATRFSRTGISDILINPFSMGLVSFRGQTYPGRHQPIVDMDVFDQCQDILKGKNRRSRKVNHHLAGGMFVCAHCGYGITGERIRQARKRLTDLEQMQERLLDGLLGGAIDQKTFNSRRAAMQVEAERLTQELEDDTARHDDAGVGEYVVAMFDFAQDAAERWRVSKKSDRRAILARLLLKRSLSDVSLDTVKRRPFDVLAEGPFSHESRGGRI